MDELGVIVICGENKFENNMYIMGFRGRGEYDRFYLLDHLIMEYEPTLRKIQEDHYVKHGMYKSKDDLRMPAVIDTSPYRMNEAYKQILKDNVNNPAFLLRNTVKDHKNIFQILFHRNDFFRLPLQKTESSVSRFPYVCQNDTRRVSK